MSKPQPDWRPAVAHLIAHDAKMAALIARVGPCTLTLQHRHSIFYSLASSIVYQQLAGAAASAILARVERLFSPGRITPARLLAMDETLLRSAGLSQNKLAALRDLAAKCLDGTVPTQRKMAGMSDDEIVARVSLVRGIGRWTVEMMLIFRLGRPNVLPVDDYGVRKGLQRLYRLRELPNKAAMLRRAKKWQPWSSIASWYLWRCAELPAPASPRKSAKTAAPASLTKSRRKN
jgi:DNA-3-methyladenine glycosylase II